MPNSMLLRNRFTVVIATFIVSSFCFDTFEAEAATHVTIVADAAREGEFAAANELGCFLQRLYPNTTFYVGRRIDGNLPTKVVILGTRDSRDGLLNDEQRAALNAPGSFVVFTRVVDGIPTGCIIGADLEGIWNGVYGLLKKLGCGFYLSFDAMPPQPAGEFSFADWNLRDRPLVPVRVVFNWHNFLSGCSTWNLEHWRHWIVQSRKMGYIGLMVHAYGNNPMAGFTFDGQPKPVGYLASTRIGRDWNTHHVNDVRRMVGGDAFDDPVFGCEAAIDGSHYQRTAASRELMSKVFDAAETRGMKVYFGVDVDTYAANPQELIKRLPDRARFVARIPGNVWLGQPAGPFWMADPDTPEGYAFYQAQVKQLLEAYPRVDTLVAWHRGSSGGSPWTTLEQEDLPRKWREEFLADAEKHPELAKQRGAVGMFAVAKIVRAMQRAARESGFADVRIAVGTWRRDFLPLKDHYFPRDAAFVFLDYEVLRNHSAFDSDEHRAAVAHVASRREVIPIAWAHHDDGDYVGRPYTPATEFMTKLTDMKCDASGYGVIHWTTRPLDLYFSSLANQVWASSRDEPLRTTCRRMAGHMVGPARAEAFGDYLHDWVSTSPKIGRETSDFFIDHALPDPHVARGEMERRLTRLDAMDLSDLSASQRDWIAFFRQLEHVIVKLHESDFFFRQAEKALAGGDLAGARRAMRQARPEETIEAYAACVALGGISRGEQGLLVTLNTRWLSHYVRLRQQIGLEPVRYNFGPTFHERLAQSPGIHTFHFDHDRHLWEVLGERETGSPAYNSLALSAIRQGQTPSRTEDEIGMSGLVSDAPIRFEIRPIMRIDSRRNVYREPPLLAPGRYRLGLLFGPGEHAKVAPGEIDIRVSTIKGRAGRDESTVTRRIAPSSPSNEKSSVRIESFDVLLAEPDAVTVELVPVKGTVWISGVVLAPVAD